ncbi:hypothetical protein ACU4GA_32925 [Methylobacterium oryzae CBMB20]
MYAQVEAAGTSTAAPDERDAVLIKPSYDPDLVNEDLARCASRPGAPTTSSPSGCRTCTASADT